jgi:Zn-dependent M28 family amino/carboxypeptidase
MLHRFRRIACLLLLSSTLLFAQKQPGIANHVRAEMSFLASDALRGRGSATRDELVAATYVVSQFQSFGLEGAEVQRVPLASGGATYNAIALLRGSDAELTRQTILLSSHLDHLGARATADGEVIYHGADDDASGTTAVLELARALGAMSPRPRRTILFVCFGSEETGGQGDQYFLSHPPLPLASIVANLEFEMMGQGDRAIGHDQLWLSGWERTDLGPALAGHGAPLVADPHPAQHFFQRSDNFNLARRGIIAQTVSSYGLGAHYHQPTDDLAHIDFDHLSHAIDALIPPIQWLANTGWKPSWKSGGRP